MFNNLCLYLPRLKLDKLKVSFLPVPEDSYDLIFNNLVKILEDCKFLKILIIENFSFKYKHIVGNDIKEIILNNLNLRKLVIRSETPFYVHYIEGCFYLEYPKFSILPFCFAIKQHLALSKLYKRKQILKNIFDSSGIKKEKTIAISYKI
jgi:hypothetical protein